MKPIFLDSSGLIAVANTDDQELRYWPRSK